MNASLCLVLLLIGTAISRRPDRHHEFGYRKSEGDSYSDESVSYGRSYNEVKFFKELKSQDEPVIIDDSKNEKHSVAGEDSTGRDVVDCETVDVSSTNQDKSVVNEYSKSQDASITDGNTEGKDIPVASEDTINIAVSKYSNLNTESNEKETNSVDRKDQIDRVVDSDLESEQQLNFDEHSKPIPDKYFFDFLRQATGNSSTIVTTTAAPKQSPCKCGGGVCGCCSRILYDRFKQRACVNISYDPDEFSFTANVMMNDRVLFTRTISGKNPRPICVPIPQIPFVRACVRFYNIYFQGRNIHLCVSMEGKFSQTTVFKVGLDCMRFGANGLAIVKPEDGGGLEFLPGDDDDSNDNNDDDYDDDYENYDDDDDDDDDDY